ncbi:MAG TPA: hypothetical protein VGM89_01520, partial [Puia sp.]
MLLNITTFETRLASALGTFDKQTANVLCSEFITYLQVSEEQIPARTLERILQMLRNKRLFTLMQQVAEAYIRMGRQTH